MDQRRQLPRFEIKKRVKVDIPQIEGFNSCIIEDMHLKGMGVSFNKKLPAPAHAEDSYRSPRTIRMSFTIGDYFEPIKIGAQIHWEKEDQGRYAYGMSFTEITDHDKDRIYKYLNAIHYDQFKDKWWS